VVDETGDVTKGACTVGVQRQYTGTAGRIENSQVAVYLTYAGAKGYAFIDRELYLPKAWAEDAERRAAAGVPDDVEFATKPALAKAMIDRAVTAGLPAGWAAGDETSDAVRESSGDGSGCGKGSVFVVGLSGAEAVVQAAEEAVEQVALGGGVSVSGAAASVVVGARSG
jgi:hypothetical protein